MPVDLQVSVDSASEGDLSRFELLCSSPKAWATCVLANLDAFLKDHASCERKAAAQALALVSRYPDHPELVEVLIGLAREELEHFHMVTKLLHDRGQLLGPDEKDEYVNAMLSICRNGKDERLLDRLVMSALVEARSFERLCILIEAMEGHPLRDFMERFHAAESGHRRVFIRLAERYYPREQVASALARFLPVEAAAVSEFPIRPAFH